MFQFKLFYPLFIRAFPETAIIIKSYLAFEIEQVFKMIAYYWWSCYGLYSAAVYIFCKLVASIFKLFIKTLY